MRCSVHEKAFAKINLHLRVLPPRGDGFHDIESIFQKVPLFDELLIEMAEKDYGCQVSCADFQLPVINTITTAYNHFCALTGFDKGVHVTLCKRIPSGAGMGGGSSDAASMLHGLQKLAGIQLSDAELHSLAAKIGSDVFFFLSASESAAVVTGRGENVRYILPRRDLNYVLVSPGVSSSTKEAYHLVDSWKIQDKTSFPQVSALECMYNQRASAWNFSNSFTDPLANQYPEIASALNDVRSCAPDFADMTGSGSVVFGVFEDKNAAENAFTQLNRKWEKCHLLPSF